MKPDKNNIQNLKDRDITVLAIESSCDETAAAVIRNGREIMSNIVATQIEIHKKSLEITLTFMI